MSDNLVYVIAHQEIGCRLELDSHRLETHSVNPLGFYKIGVAKDPEKRLETLRSGTPHNLELKNVIECDDAEGVEEMLHRLLSGWNVCNEWYKVPPNTVNSLIAFDRLTVKDLRDVERYRQMSSYSRGTSLYVEVMKTRGGGGDLLHTTH